MNAINPRPVMYNIIEEEPMVDTTQKNEAPRSEMFQILYRLFHKLQLLQCNKYLRSIILWIDELKLFVR